MSAFRTRSVRWFSHSRHLQSAQIPMLRANNAPLPVAIAHRPLKGKLLLFMNVLLTSLNADLASATIREQPSTASTFSFPFPLAWGYQASVFSVKNKKENNNAGAKANAARLPKAYKQVRVKTKKYVRRKGKNPSHVSATHQRSILVGPPGLMSPASSSCTRGAPPNSEAPEALV